MASNIKGITIEIDGNVTPLTKSLEGVNKESKDLQSELKQVDRLLKLDPKNTELLAQKQKLLNDAVGNTKTKLDTLKDAERQVQAQFEKGEVGEEQYRAIQREVIKTEQNLKNLEGQLNKVGWDKVAKGMKNFGDKATSVGKGMAAGVTAPIVTAGAAAFKFGADLQDAFGATDQIFKGASDNVKEWADSLESYYGISEEEALAYSNTMGAMLQNIGGLGEKEAAKQASTLVQLAGDLTAMFGGTTESAVLALTGALKGENSMLDNYGMGVNEATIKTKAMEMGLIDEGKQLDLAGKQAATLALIMEQTGDAQGQAARESDGASGSMRALGTEVKNIAGDIGETLIPIITPFIAKIKEVVQNFGEMSPEMQKTIVTVAGLAAAIGPVLIVVGKMATGISGIIGLFGAAGGAAGVFGGALAVITGPVGLAVAGVAALGAGAVALAHHLKKPSMESKVFSDEISKSTQEALGSFLDLNDKATVALDELVWSGKTVTQDMAESITGNFKEMGNQVLEGMQEDYSKRLETMQEFFDSSSALSAEEEEEILQKMKEEQSNKETEVKGGQKRVNEILNTAKKEKRSITESERKEINNIQKAMTDNAIQYLTENEREQKVILERLKSESSKMSAEQSAEVVKNSKKQKDKVVKEANEQYDKTVAEIIKQRDEVGTISAEQADKLIKDAKEQRDETVKNATSMHDNVVKEAKAQAGEHVKQVDWESGEVKSKWQVMKESVSNKAKEMKDSVSTHLEGMKKATADKMNNIKKSFTEKMDGAKDGVKKAIDKIKGFFKFKWELPKLKMPHFNVSGKFSLNPPSTPKFGIEWYKSGAIFTSPTIFNTPNGLKGVGEAGAEAVLPIEKLDGIVASAMKKAGGSMPSEITINSYTVLDGEMVAQSVNKVNLRNDRRFKPA